MTTEPLMLVPGLNCTAALYGPQLGPVGQGRALVIPDHRSHDTLADMAAAALAAAPARFALCGLSMGGYLAFEMLRQAPDRITRLALLDTSARGAAEASNAPRRQMMALAEKGAFEEVAGLLWQKLVAPSRLGDSALRAVVAGMARETGPEVFVRQQRAIMGRPDSLPLLAGIRVPTLVVVGSDDQITPPEHAQEMAHAIPGAELVVIPGCGHLSTLEAPDECTRHLLRWLGRG
jgi:pimeloyl-ACP methyl ester carboxylesterase